MSMCHVMRLRLVLRVMFKMPLLSVSHAYLVMFVLQGVRVLFVKRVLRRVRTRLVVRLFLSVRILLPARRLIFSRTVFFRIVVQHLSDFMLQSVPNEIECDQHNENL